MSRASLIFLGWLILGQVFGQVDTILDIDSILILGKPLRTETTGTSVISLDLAKPEYLPVNSIAQLAGESGALFIKSYGLGSLATTSFRGANAGQTLVLWNGLPLQSPTLGQLDFSLLPANFVDEVSINTGGSSTLWGSGAVAGSIMLKNSTSKEDLIRIKSEVGSFSRLNQNLEFSLGSVNLRSTTRVTFQRAQNNFSYKAFPGAVAKELENASYNNQGIMQSLNLEMGSNRNLDLHFWWQKTNRQIPPLLTQLSSQAKQIDNARRLAVIYRSIHLKSKDEFKLAFFNEENKFEDPDIDLSSRNLFSTVLLDYEREWFYKNWFRFSLGSTQSFTSANTPAYDSRISEFQGALFATAYTKVNRLEILASIRKQWTRDQNVPVNPSASFEYQFSSLISLKGKISKDYRLPTLNDRYWIPGGNEDLNAEEGWSEEVGFSLHSDPSKMSWKYEITGYNRIIRNWILWARTEGQSFFSPQNITRVWSRGVENNFTFRYNMNSNWEFNLKLTGNILRSTNEVSILNPDIAEGEQLIYTPEHTGLIKALLAYKNMTVAYSYIFTGGYSGINAEVPAYDLGSLDLNGLIHLKKQKLQWYLRIDNLWNENYQVIENRPMPGRNFLLGFQVEFKKE